MESFLLHGFPDDFLRAAPYFFGIVFHPSGLGEYLFVFPLRSRNDSSGMIEDDEARARRALINRAQVCCHCGFLRNESQLAPISLKSPPQVAQPEARPAESTG